MPDLKMLFIFISPLPCLQLYEKKQNKTKQNRQFCREIYLKSLTVRLLLLL